MTTSHTIGTVSQLEALFGVPGDASLKKQVPYLHPNYQALIAASPFAVLATIGPGGLDASPRGDPPGFVVVQDEKTLLMPERRGNNRIDSLRNIVADPRVALLFLIPGVGETLRVNGRAQISVEPALLERFAMEGKLPQMRDPRDGGDGVLPLRAGDPAFEAVGAAADGCKARGADAGRDPVGADRIRLRRGSLRPGAAGAAASDALLSRRHDEKSPRKRALSCGPWTDGADQRTQWQTRW